MRNVMLKKIKRMSVCIVISVLVLLILCSCSDSKNLYEDTDNKNPQIENIPNNTDNDNNPDDEDVSGGSDVDDKYENEPVDVKSHTFYGRYAFPVVEDENYVWFVKSDGIYKKDKRDGSVSSFYFDNEVSALTLYGNNIFFTSDQGYKIKKISKNGGDADEIFNLYLYENVDNSLSCVNDYIIHDGKIYVVSPMEVYTVNIETGEYEKLGIDISDRQMQIYGNEIYYIPHASRTFSMYALNIETGDNRLIRGHDVSYPESDLVRRFIITDEGTYTFERNPNRIVYYDGTGGFYVVDEGIFSDIFIRDGKLFGLKCADTEGETASLMCYEEDKGIVVAELPDCGNYGLAVCDGFVYYTTFSSGNREIKSVALAK